MIQISIAQLDNYGPWTVSPEPKPEADLQMLQTRFFSDLEEEFSKRGGLAFLGRFDNTLIVSNGIGLEGHREIQKTLGREYPVTLSFGIGVGEGAYEAQRIASEALQREGSSQSPERKEVIAGDPINSTEDGKVQIAHIDVNRATEITDEEPIYDTHHLMQEVYIALSDSFSSRGSLVFYTGGDNFMAPSNGLSKSDITEAIFEVEEETGVELKAGVGQAPLAVDAAYLASEGLHAIRDGKTTDKVFFENSG